MSSDSDGYVSTIYSTDEEKINQSKSPKELHKIKTLGPNDYFTSTDLKYCRNLETLHLTRRGVHLDFVATPHTIYQKLTTLVVDFQLSGIDLIQFGSDLSDFKNLKTLHLKGLNSFLDIDSSDKIFDTVTTLQVERVDSSTKWLRYFKQLKSLTLVSCTDDSLSVLDNSLPLHKTVERLIVHDCHLEKGVLDRFQNVRLLYYHYEAIGVDRKRNLDSLSFITPKHPLSKSLVCVNHFGNIPGHLRLRQCYTSDYGYEWCGVMKTFTFNVMCHGLAPSWDHKYDGADKPLMDREQFIKPVGVCRAGILILDSGSIASRKTDDHSGESIGKAETAETDDIAEESDTDEESERTEQTRQTDQTDSLRGEPAVKSDRDDCPRGENSDPATAVLAYVDAHDRSTGDTVSRTMYRDLLTMQYHMLEQIRRMQQKIIFLAEAVKF